MVELHIGKFVMKNKFDFEEIVIVSSDKPELSKINNTCVVISGMSQDDDKNLWGYAVSMFNDSGICWFITEEDLIATGRKSNRNEFDTLETIRVRVDPI